MPDSLIRACTVPVRLVRAVLLVVTSFRLLRWCLPPWIIGISATWVAFDIISNRIEIAIREGGLFSQPIIQHAVSYLGIGCSFIGAAVVGLVCSLVAGAFFFDLLVEEALQRHGAILPASCALGERVSRIARGIGADVVIVIVLALTAVVGFMLSFIPPLAFISALLGVFILGFELADKPLSILEVPLRARLSLTRRHILECLTLGGTQSLAILIPGANIVLLPAFYVLAAEVVARWQRGSLEAP